MNVASAAMREWRRRQTAQAAPVAVAVPEADAPRVAWVLTNGSVVLALGGA